MVTVHVAGFFPKCKYQSEYNQWMERWVATINRAGVSVGVLRPQLEVLGGEVP